MKHRTRTSRRAIARRAGRAAALGLALAAAAAAARADLLAYEGFAYATPTLGNGDGGQGWSTPWYGFEAIDGSPGGAASLGIRAPSLPVAGGSFSPAGGHAFEPTSLGSGPQARRRLATPLRMDVDQTYYVSFLLRRDTDPNATLNNLDAYVALLAGGGSSPLLEAFRVGGGAIGAPDNLQIIGSTGIPGPTASAVAGDFTNGVSYFLVARIDASAAGLDSARLAAYPGLENAVPATEPATWLIGPGGEAPSPTWDGAQVIDRIRVAGQAAFSIDEIRIGTTWADVTGPVPGAPAIGGSLAGAGAGVLLASCRNSASGQRVPVLTFGQSAWDCVAGGLQAASGDPIGQLLLATATVTSPAPAPLGGRLEGVTGGFLLYSCRNATTGQSVAGFAVGQNAWDCRAQGLAASPGDAISVFLVGSGAAN